MKEQKTKEAGIYTLPDGRYKIIATIMNPSTGKPIYRRETMKPDATLELACVRRDQLKTMMRSELAGEPVPIALDTLGNYAVRWFQSKAPSLSPNSQRTYLDALDTKILPFIGDVPCAEVNRALLARWVGIADRMEQEDGSSYARDTRRGWWRVLKQLAQDMRADVGMVLDPTDRIKPPSADGGQHRERHTMSSEQLRQFLTTIRAVSPRAYPETLVLATTGMRAGELYGLQWDDIDHDAQIIHIRRGSTRDGLKETTKTGAGRTVPLLPRVAEELRRHHQQLHDQDSLGLARLNLVFPSEAGTVRTASNLHKPMAATCAVMELPFVVTPQVIRRSFNTILLHAGVNEVVLRAMMGHASQEMTALYMGVEMQDKRAHLIKALSWVEETTLHPDFAPTPGALHIA